MRTGFSYCSSRVLRIAALLWCMSCNVAAAVYEVGPGRPFVAVSSVPWEALLPGDVVRIHWRDQPYREKWVICRQGTSTAPITVSGVPHPATGALPVIDASGAVTRPQLNFWNENRALIKIGGANSPPDTEPRHIVLENLELRGARPPHLFQGRTGTASYVNNAAAVFIEKGTDIILRNCELHDSGNGLFVSWQSSNILVEANYIHDNGNAGSIYEHNSYTEASGIVFQYNRYGPLRAGCPGNNLKDRSAGLVVRYNWIEGGNRQLDLVDAQGSAAITADPRYRTTLVYGNVLVEPGDDGNSQIVHYGGDSAGGEAGYRKGTLHFYNNTVVSNRSGNTTLLRLSTNDEHCDMRNNVVYVTQPGSRLAMVDGAGRLAMTHNWMKAGWRYTHGALTGVVTDDGTTVIAADPAFADEPARDYHLRSTSTCRDAGTALDPSLLPAHDVSRQYVKHRASEVRPPSGPLDIGAYEFAGSTAAPPQPSTAVLTVSVVPPGSGSVSPSGGYFTVGSTVVLTAQSHPGYLFAGWSGDVVGSSMANPTSVTMTADKALAAHFAAVPVSSAVFSLSGRVADSSGVPVHGCSVVLSGVSGVREAATAATGDYLFIGVPVGTYQVCGLSPVFPVGLSGSGSLRPDPAWTYSWLPGCYVVSVTTADVVGLDFIVTAVPVRPQGMPGTVQIIAGDAGYYHPVKHARCLIRFSANRDGDVAVRILTLRGALVDEVLCPASAGGVLWNGTDRDGRPVASGVYLVHVTGPGLNTTRRFAVLR